ncbi:MAG: AAA family ATPase [Acidobacteria bacterium]|nr:AAA family ATPase [Acidobacteriota bacterium]
MSNQPNSFTSPLAAFMAEFHLSLSDLQRFFGPPKIPSRTTLHRLRNNNLNANLAASLERQLAVALPPFLRERGLGPAQIEEQIQKLIQRGDDQQMISKRIELSPEAQKHFGLSEDPFSRPPQHRDEVFVSREFQRVIDRVIDAVRYQGFVVVTGEIGSGKSTLRALVEDYVFENRNLHIVWPEFFDMRNVTPMQIASCILESFGITRAPGSAVRRGNAVKNLLATQYKDGNRVALGIDEAHRLNNSALSSLKNFLEMSSGGFQRYLGVVLFGQPIFEARLADPQFREIHERITTISMPDFRDSAADYLDHRLRLVGKRAKDLFDDEAIDLVCRQASTPLQLGNIANEALMVSGPRTKAYPDAFANAKVIGAAIRTKMFFENRNPAFKKRAA